MAKIDVQSVLDAGFRAEQFPPAADFASSTGYLKRAIDEQSTLLRGRVGAAAYDAETSDTSIGMARLKRAELYLVIAELWRRRAAFVDGNASHAAETSPERNRAEYLRHAREADEVATLAIDEFIAGTDGPGTGALVGMSMGTVETGRFPPVLET